MGISSDGILVFGVDLGSIEEDGVKAPWHSEDGEGEGFDDWLGKLADADTTPMWEHHYKWIEEHPEVQNKTSGEQVSAWEGANPEMRASLNAAYEKAREAREACPIDVVLHCAYDYAMEIVAVRGTETRAYRGTPKEITTFEVDPQRLEAARAFCLEHGIPFEDPKWLLTSIFG